MHYHIYRDDKQDIIYVAVPSTMIRELRRASLVGEMDAPAAIDAGQAYLQQQGWFYESIFTIVSGVYSITYQLVQQFALMLRTRTGGQLDAWLDAVFSTPLPDRA